MSDEEHYAPEAGHYHGEHVEQNLPVADSAAPPRHASLVNRLVAASLRQGIIVVLLMAMVTGVGIWSFKRLPVDAYPDLSPPMVEVSTQWPGHAAEEVERLITAPVELGLNGVPGSQGHAIHFAVRAERRAADVRRRDGQLLRAPAGVRAIAGRRSFPAGLTASVAPLASPSGLVYRYVLQSPDRSAMDLKVLQDWVLERQYKSVPGVADMSSLGGETRQYQVVIDPARLAGAGLTVPAVAAALDANNGNAGGGFYSEGGQFYYVRGHRTRAHHRGHPEHRGRGAQRHSPVLVKDIGDVVIGHAPRLGQFGFNDQNDAVEGVIRLRTGEQAQTVLKAVETEDRRNQQRDASG